MTTLKGYRPPLTISEVRGLGQTIRSQGGTHIATVYEASVAEDLVEAYNNYQDALDVVRDLVKQIEKFAEEQGEADFETGRAKQLLAGRK